jgi:hypothetical protein
MGRPEVERNTSAKSIITARQSLITQRRGEEREETWCGRTWYSHIRQLYTPEAASSQRRKLRRAEQRSRVCAVQQRAEPRTNDFHGTVSHALPKKCISQVRNNEKQTNDQ